MARVNITNIGNDCKSEVGQCCPFSDEPVGQALNIGGCSDMGKVLHELMHTLGKYLHI